MTTGTPFFPLYLAGAPPGSILTASEVDTALPMSYATTQLVIGIAIETDTALSQFHYTPSVANPPRMLAPIGHGHGVDGGFLRMAWAYTVIHPDGTVVEYATYAEAAADVAAHPGSTITQVPAPPLTVTLVDRADFHSNPVRLTDAYGKRFQDELNEAGSGSIVMLNDDPQVGLLSYTRAVQFSVSGHTLFTALLEADDMVQVTEQEESAEDTTFTGRGGVTILQDACVYPTRGVGVTPVQDDRAFNWTVPEYDDSGWLYATPIGPQSGTFHYWTGMPSADWPDPTAQWIWAKKQFAGAPALDEWDPAGPCYFRKTFTVPAGIDRVIVVFAADAAGTVYFDGLDIVQVDNGADDPTQIKTVVLEASPGPHTLAAEVTNDIDPEGDQIHNPAGLLFAVYSASPTGAVVALLAHSDGSWRIVEYPPHPPGMTPGEVMMLLINESKFRGCFPNLTMNFNKYTDSAGNPWPEVANIGTKVGNDLFTFLAKELGPTYCDFRMAPASQVLSMWNRGGLGSAKSVTYAPPSNPLDPASGNIATLTRKRSY